MPGRDYIASAFDDCTRPGEVASTFTPGLVPPPPPPSYPTAGLLLNMDAQLIPAQAEDSNIISITEAAVGNVFMKPSYVSGYPKYKAATINGKPAVRFLASGLNNTLPILNCVRNDGYWRVTQPTMYAVMSWLTSTTTIYRRGPGPAAQAGEGWRLGRRPSGVGGGSGVSDAVLSQNFYHGEVPDPPEPANQAMGVAHVVCMMRYDNGANGYRQGLWINSAWFFGASGSAVQDFTPAASSIPFSLCAFYDTGASTPDGLTRCDLDLGHVMLYDHYHSDADRIATIAYLAARWGITL